MKLSRFTQKLGFVCAAVVLTLALPTPVFPQKIVNSLPGPVLTYADLADLSLASTLVGYIRIRKAQALKPGQSVGLLPGRKRYLITADLVSLILGDGGLLPRIAFLADVASDSRGKQPKLGKAQMIVFAVPGGGRLDEVRLVSPDAMISATPDALAKVRSILSQARATDAPLPLGGITDVYHVAGSIEGEGETQIFLQTTKGVPVSLSVTRLSGQEPQWSVALSELVDEGLRPPPRDTFLWYRLACFLPRTLPAQSIADLATSDAESARRDYGFILSSLGPCPRTLRIRP